MASAVRMTVGKSFETTGAQPVYATQTIDASNDGVEWIFQAEESITCTRIGVNWSAVTSPPVMRVSLRSIDATTGRASATILGATNNALKTFTPTATWEWYTLDETADLTGGTYYAIVLEYSSGTVGASNLGTVRYGYGASSLFQSTPYPVTVTAGSGTKSTNLPCYGYGSSTKAYGAPGISIAYQVFDSGTSPMEVGMAFTIPRGLCGTYTVLGVRVHASYFTSTGKGASVVIYGGILAASPVALQTLTVDSDNLQAANAVRTIEWLFPSASLATLVAGVEYCVAIAPDSATSDFNMSYFTVSVQADLDAYSGGQNCYYVARNSGGATAFTATGTRRPMMELILGDISQLPKAALTGGMQA